MSDLTLVLLGAGESNRFGLPVKKQWLRIGDMPLWLFVTKRFTSMATFKDVIITAPRHEKRFFERYCDFKVVEGGTTRQDSINNALDFVQSEYVLISDIARACIKEDVLKRIIEHKGVADCVAPYIPSPDTVVYRNETIDRSEVKLIQTPQLSRTALLRQALQGQEFTDESSAMRAIGARVAYIPGDIAQRKLTYKEDLQALSCLKPPSSKQLVGHGFDVHAFCENRPLFLCGEEIAYHQGLVGHSDADVAIHAIIDALLGAAGFGDIGELFPDSDEAYRDIDSKILLDRCAKLLRACGFEIGNIDLTIMAQAPKLLDYKPAMQRNIAKILDVPQFHINIKATTTEKLGFIGRKEGIAAQAIATLYYFDWSKA